MVSNGSYCTFFSVLFTEEVPEPQLPAPLPLQTLFVNRLSFVAGEVEDGRVSPTLWYSTPPPDDIDPEVDLVRYTRSMKCGRPQGGGGGGEESG